jgi:aminoglycoside phosphotransferase (APT) family kinase protein
MASAHSRGFDSEERQKAGGAETPRHVTESQKDFLERLIRDGVVRSQNATMTPLTDGVSSEIYRVDDGDDSFVVKRALAKLKVKDNWLADVNRNLHEQRYISYVSRFVPDSVPRLRSGAMDRGYFAMELLGPEFRSWKRLLFEGQTSSDSAVQAAALLGQIHARSAGDPDVEAMFATTANFMQLRIDPYLLTTGSRHESLCALFQAEAQRLASTRQCLVHGDFSPKNIMISPSRMVLLDCEVAWYGDPAFDVAFLLTHLLLKGLYHAPVQKGFDAMCLSFWRQYQEQVNGAFDLVALEPRVARLMLMLLLARVDGKSPVEYLTHPWQADPVRRFTYEHLSREDFRLSETLEDWFAGLRKLEARQ